MMREIKFKVWDEVDKKWVSKFFIQINNDGERTVSLPTKHIPPVVMKGGVRDGEVINEGGVILPFLDPDKCKVMQYTGLKDKNGKEIYEGDILKFDTIFSEREVKNNKGTTSRVFWAGTGFYVRGTSYSCTLDKAINIEIIGNIYENPELLKKK